MDILLVILLILFGVAFLIVELFLLPGFGIAGVAGFLSLAGAVGFAYCHTGALAGHITLGISIVLCIAAVWWFLRSRTLDKMALHTNITAQVDSARQLGLHAGDRGICVSRLAPMGKVRINGIEVEAKSHDSFLEASTPVEVVAIESNRVIVTALADNNSSTNNI